ncbi:MotE family protein [Roseibium sp. RKSG952]|uniref:MotE family protein n=1 Tax=Roseibium sp. RKSG952 TaxID=2529384 RepID=UPI0012BD04A3|nr:hypothetical protein [Roseibium sp. RKSG952]MTH97628.1 hypothetical protein [Roseibium sp. RKSG952]
MNVRLLPLVAISAGALLLLKLLGFAFNEEPRVAAVREAVAQNVNTQPAPPPDTLDVPPLPEGADGPFRPLPAFPDNLEIGGSAAERAVLESLGKRRETLAEQEGQLELREKLLQATEQRIQQKLDELKLMEARIETAVQQQEQKEDAEIAGLVTMYENMKAKDAARIFDQLNITVLMKIVRQMNPRKMADILGRMSPDAAERLTMAMAGENDVVAAREQVPMARMPVEPADLPKIPSN